MNAIARPDHAPRPDDGVPDEAAAARTALLARAWDMLRERRPDAAAPLLDAARRLGPASALQAELDARLAVARGRHDEAMAGLDMAVAALPDDGGLRRCRAELRLALGDPARAAADAADAVLLDRADAPSKAVLGTALLALGRGTDALACLTEAAAALPDDPRIACTQAAALEACGHAGLAEVALRGVVARAPDASDARATLVLHLIRAGRLDEALAETEAARAAGLADACLAGLRGHALSSLGRHEEAARAYAEALRLGPEDDYVRHLAVAGSGDGASGFSGSGADRAPADYLRCVFDGYAARFDAHLLSLGYRVPGLIRACLLEHAPDAAGPVLDLGCGTGLVGAALGGPLVGPLVGVDIAPRMLEQAVAKGVYAALHEADIPAFLACDARRWRAVLAADALCYFGALEPLLTAIRARLTRDGITVFSLEETQDDGGTGWRLSRNGRYAHSELYVRAAARKAGLRLRALRRETLRWEAGAPVGGLLAVAAPDDLGAA